MLTVHIDGASKGNPGPSGIGIIVFRNNSLILSYGEFIGFHTNLLSEYLALKRALQFAVLIDKEIRIHTDSMTIVQHRKSKERTRRKELETRRHPGRRHGPWKNAANTLVDFLAKASQWQECEALPRDLPGVGPVQLASRSRAIHPAPESADPPERRGAAQPAQADPTARHHRHELRPAAPRSRGASEVSVQRRHP